MPNHSHTQTLEALKEQVRDLTADDKLRLASYLVEQARTSLHAMHSGRSWHELRGLYSYPMMGEDAQTWVSRARQEGDAQRAQPLQTPR